MLHEKLLFLFQTCLYCEIAVHYRLLLRSCFVGTECCFYFCANDCSYACASLRFKADLAHDGYSKFLCKSVGSRSAQLESCLGFVSSSEARNSTDCTFTEPLTCGSQPIAPYLKSHSLQLGSWNSWCLSWFGVLLFYGESYLCSIIPFIFFVSPTFHNIQDWSSSMKCQEVATELACERRGCAL